MQHFYLRAKMLPLAKISKSHRPYANWARLLKSPSELRLPELLGLAAPMFRRTERSSCLLITARSLTTYSTPPKWRRELREIICLGLLREFATPSPLQFSTFIVMSQTTWRVRFVRTIDKQAERDRDDRENAVQRDNSFSG